jgi:hypothetical protein
MRQINVLHGNIEDNSSKLCEFEGLFYCYIDVGMHIQRYIFRPISEIQFKKLKTANPDEFVQIQLEIEEESQFKNGLTGMFELNYPNGKKEIVNSI